MRKFTPENIKVLGKDEVFVFGSNLAGQHMGGAARVARERFGAKMCQGVGMQGQSYAIPTMQGGVETIKPYVDQFLDYAYECDQTLFYVTRIGCGIAGFKDEQIAPLFDRAVDMYNVILPESFYKIILSNRAKKVAPILTEWPNKKYCLYDLFIDQTLVLANKSKGWSYEEFAHAFESEIHTNFRSIGLHDCPDWEVSKYLYRHRKEVIAETNMTHITGRVSELFRAESYPIERVPFNRYFVVKCVRLAYMLLRTMFLHHDNDTGGCGYDFNGAFFGTITGRWSCGDFGYMFDDIEACLEYWLRVLRDNWSSLSAGRDKWTKEKVLGVLSRPEYCDYINSHDGHQKQEMGMLLYRLDMLVHEGDYKKVADWYIPVRDMSQPVFKDGVGRIPFHTYELKQAFIKSMTGR